MGRQPRVIIEIVALNSDGHILLCIDRDSSLYLFSIGIYNIKGKTSVLLEQIKDICLLSKDKLFVYQNIKWKMYYNKMHKSISIIFS